MVNILSANARHTFDRDACIDLFVIGFFLVLFAPPALFGSAYGLPVLFQLLVVAMIAFLGHDAAAIRSPVPFAVLCTLIIGVLCGVAVMQLFLHGWIVMTGAILALSFVLFHALRARSS